MSEAWTIRSVLQWTAKDFAAKGIDSARLDAELLAAEALGLERVGLYLDLDRPLSTDELGRIRALVRRRRDREPVAYILGRRDFFGRTFEVTPDVLIPRPDTETLVERALERLPPDRPARVAELCTGSGIIAISLAAERPSIDVDASDIDPGALAVAQRNVDRHGLAERVRLYEGNLFEPLPRPRYDLVCANPPYVREGELPGLQPEIRRYEPELALAAGPDGLDFVRRIVREAGSRLSPGGVLLLEVGAEQADRATALCAEVGLRDAMAHRDLAGIERVVEARVPSA